MGGQKVRTVIQFPSLVAHLALVCASSTYLLLSVQNVMYKTSQTLCSHLTDWGSFILK